MKKKLLFHVHDQQCSTAKAWCCLLLLFAGICSVHAQVQYPLSLKNKGYKARPQGMNVSKLAPTPFVASPSVGSWTTLTNLAPSGGGAMTLLSDGTVLVKNASSGSLLYKKLTPDASGSYINGTWSFIWPMFDSRLYYSSQLLKDGRLYVAGGEYGTGGSRGEIYNPVTNTWKLANLPGITLSDANSEILDDGRVLQGAVGGTGKQTFLYDPATNTYTNGPNTLDYYNEAAWVKLPDGSILMVDVPFEGDDHSTERYIPSLNQWVLDAPAPVSLFDLFGYETGGACLLPNGKVIFFGSTGHTAIYTPSGNNSPGSWVAGPDFPDGQGTPDAAAAMMANGKVLCAVSPIPDQFDNFPSPTSFYEYDYVSNSFTQVGAPGGGSYIINSSFVFTFLNLPDGTILASQQGDQNLYVYTPAGSQVEEGKPVITSIDQKTCSTYTLHGTGFNGNSEGSSYGDDWQMNTNYPIVRLTSGSNVYYGRTTDWNSTGVRRGNAPDSVNVALPAGLPDGTYSLVVTANGIASDPITITTTPKTWYLDADGDGYYVTAVSACANPGPGYTTDISIPGDCNDADGTVWQSGSLYIDADGDGYDNGQAYVCYGATAPTGYSLTTNGTDCNDADASVWQTAALYIDADGDGYDNGQADVCYGDTAPTGYSLTTNGTDCNDADASVWQTAALYIDADGDGYDNGQADICYGATVPSGYSLTTNGTDCNDADASVWQTGSLYIDVDGDGYDNGQADICYGATAPTGYSLTTNGTDCNDADASVHEPQLYYVDNDHDGFGSTTSEMLCASTAPVGYATNNTDCNDADASVHEPQMYYVDNDQDGFGSTTSEMLCASTAPLGYATNNTDCNDADASVHEPQLYYVDNDHDGFGSTTTAMLCASTAPLGYATNNTDCNDADAGVHEPQLYYVDNDHDGFGSTTTAMLCASTAPVGYATNNTDCNDADASVHQSQLYYVDNDHDGFGSTTTAMLCASTAPLGYATNNTDCNDADASVHAPQLYYVDNDHDGFGSATTAMLCAATAPVGYSAKTGDCNDANAAVNPGAAEICGNGIDDNCNGQVDENCTAACQNATNLTTTGITSNSATFNWTASANPTQWQVQYKSTKQGSKWIDVTVSGTARSVTISSLAANQSYQWHIRAKCGKTCTAYSNTVSFKTLTKTRTTVNTSSIVTKAEPIDKGIRLYPNPSRGQFVVELQVAEKINTTAKIQLMNLEGQVVQAETALMNNGAVKQSVNVSPALSNGIYMVRISVNNKTYITRLVYQK